MITRIQMRLAGLFLLLACFVRTTMSADDTRWVTYADPNGQLVYLEDDRRPALYTQNFGDCLGGSAINVTRFDAAYYQDNMTVLFHLAGNTGIANDSLMMYIGVFAYGEDRFDLVFNPCSANIWSMCPVNSSVPITASGIIPVAPSDVSDIPSIAYSIPDFEGQAILRIFSNTTHNEIACYSAVVTNGGSFSQPASVGSILGILTFIAMIASFATAVYGEQVPTMRLHYAHSLSVGVVFAVWQHIFFSGALSVNWPSVLVAWWSNFAWAGGMIYSSSMQSSINHLIGNNVGNTSEVGAAQAGSANSNVGGGYDLSLIYSRALRSGMKRAANHPLARDIASEIYGRDSSNELERDITQRTVERVLQARDNTIANSSDGYHWYGKPVGAGLPLPGNYSGFAGTLAEEGIRVSNAFMTGFLWFLILLALLIASVIAFKWILEGLARIKWVKQDRLKFFRDHWLGYATVIALRTCLIAFFAMMFLTIFQFTYDSSGGVKGVAAIVFIIFFIGMPSIAAYAYWYKISVMGSEINPTQHKKLLGGSYPIPRLGKKQPAKTTVNEAGVLQESKDTKTEETKTVKPLWKRMASAGTMSSIMDRESDLHSIHDNEDYTMKFGWLASRFRRTRWWFFTFWLFYEFLRAIFYGGASGYAQAQVFGLLVVEFLAFCFILWARPFEGQRLNIIVVYCLGFSKVTSVALSAAFDVQYNLNRITTTAIGIVIIVIQGILTIITMIAIVVGAISSYMSVSRNVEDFRPRKWYNWRERYFNHLDRTVNDLPPEPKPEPLPTPPPEEPKYGFEIKTVRRMAKVEDEDEEFASEMRAANGYESPIPARSAAGTPVAGRSRTNSRAYSVRSVSSTNLPYGARPHRPSWSTRDFVDSYTDERESPPVDMSKTLAEDEPVILSPTAGKKGVTRPTSLPSKSSAEALNLGGDVSTADTIGTVPTPTMRPRAGSLRDRSMARSISSSHGYDYLQGADSGSGEGPSDPSRSSSHRNSYLGASSYGRLHPLTPAQEMEEFMTPKTSLEK